MSSLTDFISNHGVAAVFAVMAIDAVFPLGGEVTMLLAGALAAGAIAGAHPTLFGSTLSTGLESYVVLALAGTVGYLLGSLVGWWIGRRGGRGFVERHGRLLHLGPDRLERADRWFARRGTRAVFLGRLTPVVRSFISIPAGVLGSPLGPYAALTALGSAIWCFAFAAVGWILGSNYDQVRHAFSYVDVVVVIAVIALVAVVVVRRRRARRSEPLAGLPRG